LEANELKDRGLIARAKKLLEKLLIKDVRCLDAHAHLGNIAFDKDVRTALDHPRVIPEIYPLADLALENCSISPDVIVDEDATAYPQGRTFEEQDLTTEGYATLLRIERGRVRNREIFGPMRLHYGVFKLQARRSSYLIAREDGRIAGAVGFTVDPRDKAVRIFELISLHDEVIRFLLTNVERAWTTQLGGPAEFVEIDVSAYAPRMQRPLLELGFLPVAYIPAFAFDEVERLDVVKMFVLPASPEVNIEALAPRYRTLADLVLRRFRTRSVFPVSLLQSTACRSSPDS
jgi:hypothetical protein